MFAIDIHLKEETLATGANGAILAVPTGIRVSAESPAQTGPHQGHCGALLVATRVEGLRGEPVQAGFVEQAQGQVLARNHFDELRMEFCREETVVYVDEFLRVETSYKILRLGF
jgi:hypothetical protein